MMFNDVSRINCYCIISYDICSNSSNNDVVECVCGNISFVCVEMRVILI